MNRSIYLHTNTKEWSTNLSALSILAYHQPCHRWQWATIRSTHARARGCTIVRYDRDVTLFDLAQSPVRSRARQFPRTLVAATNSKRWLEILRTDGSGSRLVLLLLLRPLAPSIAARDTEKEMRVNVQLRRIEEKRRRRTRGCWSSWQIAPCTWG